MNISILVVISVLLVVAVILSIGILIDNPIGRFQNREIRKKPRRFNIWVLLALSTAVVLLIFSFLSPLIFTETWGRQPIDYASSGVIGDTIGGLMNPFIAIAAVIVTGLAFYAQYQANIIQVRNFKKGLKLEKKKELKRDVDEKLDLLKLVVLNNRELTKSLNDAIEWANGQKEEFRIERKYPDIISYLKSYPLDYLLSIPYSKLLGAMQWIGNKERFAIEMFVIYHNSILSLQQVFEFFNLNLERFLQKDRNSRNELFKYVEKLLVELDKLRIDSETFEKYQEILSDTLHNAQLQTDIVQRKEFLIRIDSELTEIQSINTLVFLALNQLNIYEANLKDIQNILEKLIVEIKKEKPKIMKARETLDLVDIDKYKVIL